MIPNPPASQIWKETKETFFQSKSVFFKPRQFAMTLLIQGVRFKCVDDVAGAWNVCL
jgi:hypothetical protein